MHFFQHQILLELKKIHLINSGVFSFKRINRNGEVTFKQTIDPTNLSFGDTTCGNLENGDTIIVTTSNVATVYNGKDASKYNKESGNIHIYRNINNELIEQSENARLTIEKINSLFKDGLEENGVIEELNPEMIQMAYSLASFLSSDELCWNLSTNKWMTKENVLNLIDVASKFETSDLENATNFYSNVQNKVNNLFTDETHKVMKDEVTRDHLKEILSLINQLKDESLKNSLLTDYNKLNNWFNSIALAEKAVYSLFKDSEHNIADFDNINDGNFYQAQIKVEKLSDGIKKDELNNLLKFISDELTEEKTANIPDQNLRKALNNALNKGNNNSDQIKIKELRILKGQLNLSNSNIIYKELNTVQT